MQLTQALFAVLIIALAALPQLLAIAIDAIRDARENAKTRAPKQSATSRAHSSDLTNFQARNAALANA